MSRPTFALALLSACPSQKGPPPEPSSAPPSEIVLLEQAPPASPRVEIPAAFTEMQRPILDRWGGSPNRRAALVLDKPLYRPGESIWVSALDLDLPSFAPRTDRTFAKIALVDPRGSVALEQKVSQQDGRANTAFDLPPGAPGGRWLVQVRRGEEVLVERPVMVQAFEAPRLKKKLEFLRDAYGPGEEVTATVSISRATGEALAETEIEARIRIDGQSLEPVKATTDSEGNAQIRFVVPAQTEVGDGMLTVRIDDGGLTEGINRRIPIVTGHVDLSLYPEGGDLVAGLPSRVYLEAKDPLGEPADVAGVVRDDRGELVASFRTAREGLGRFSFVPERGRTYKVSLTEPAGSRVEVGLPAALDSGCVLRSYDDLEGTSDSIRASVRCTEARTVVVQASMRENVLDAAAVEVKPGEESVVWLQPKGDLARMQGVARLTVFDGPTPLAERVVFRNRSRGLQITVTPRRERVTPRSNVEVDIETKDGDGNPVPATIALAVVDDTVLSFADDKHGDLVAALLLHPELPEAVREPERYLAAGDPEAALALDLLLGTRGWRRFDWAATASPLPPDPEPPLWGDLVLLGGVADAFGGAPGVAAGGGGAWLEELDEEEIPKAEAEPMAPPEAPPPAEPEPDPAPPPAIELPAEVIAMPIEDLKVAKDEAWRGDDGILFDGEIAQNMANGLAAVRIFPVPAPDPGYEGPRTDFRDTIYWNPSLTTDKSGKATASFPVSDAITSFRISADGTGGGLVGHESSLVASALPFSLAVKLPAAATEGDRIELPLSLVSEVDYPVKVDLVARFGEGLALVDGDPSGAIALPPSGRETRYAALDVTGEGKPTVALSARGSGLSDSVERPLVLSPRGFPRRFSASGQAKGKHVFEIDTSDARPGTVEGTLTMYPSPLSSLVSGLEGMLQEPSGCFEQTSSTNYPNVMVLRYLESHDAASPEIASRARSLLQTGYARLAGYETAEKGYEWFGSTPPHEALTAYGLVEFIDMKAVYSTVDAAMIDRTAEYLLSRRDGKGGYLRDSKQLDSFGAASPEVTDAYITWSLSRAGMGDRIPEEIERSRAIAKSSGDVYLLALASGALLRDDKPAGEAAVDRLVSLQDADGAFSEADHSITRSGGSNLTAESTALAALALLQDGRHPEALSKAIAWIEGNRSGWGTWGATQATVLSLQALTTYAELSSVPRGDGAVMIRVDGKLAGELRYAAGQKGTISLTGIGESLPPGKHTVEMLHDADQPMPFALAVSWRTERPAGEPSPVVALQTSLSASEASLGDSVRLTAVVSNKTEKGQPMTVARVGLPAGTSAQPWQIEELRRTGKVDFIETNTNEVVLYWRALAPSVEHTVNLDLIADIPGRYTAQASSAWLYYDDTLRTWTDPVSVQIKR